jgi:ABC-type phosphate transport system substrate-binding protein
MRLLGHGYETLQPDPFEYKSRIVANDTLSCTTTNRQFSLTSSCGANTTTTWRIGDASPTTNRSMLSLPFVLVRLVPIVDNKVDAVCEGKVNLTEALVASIYLGTISTWDDAGIVAVNPRCNFTALASKALTLVYMDDAHEATYLLTGFLSTISVQFRTKHGQSTVLDMNKLPRASQTTFAVPVQAQMEGAVVGITGAIALIPWSGTLVAKKAQITPRDPSRVASLMDCLPLTSAGLLSNSTACMPLTSVMRMNFVKDYYGVAECNHARSLVKFLKWLFLGITGSSTVDWLEVRNNFLTPPRSYVPPFPL